MTDNESILVTGATGYIGGRLVPRLLEAGYRIRCFVRSPEKLKSRSWTSHPNLEIVVGEINDNEALTQAMTGCSAGYYLVHSMQSAGSTYAKRDNSLATNFAKAAEATGVSRIIYLGGLGELGPGLSEHLRSRREVEFQLASTGVPVTVFRAAMIIGSGSASFEILRYLVERLPVMITPRWVSTETQPIAVRNVLHYLVQALAEPRTIGQTLDIGGPDVVTYKDLMHTMARLRGLGRRVVMPVPVLTPKLSSLWIDLVTPVNRHIARPLAEGLRNRTVCRDNRAAELMPQELLNVEEAIRAALNKATDENVETIWSAAGEIPGDPDWSGGTVFEEQHQTEVAASAAETFEIVRALGGDRGYYNTTWLWRLRGWMDKLVGGPGLRRGRRHPKELAYGETLDFWRVVKVIENELLILRAEMKLPGEAELEFRTRPASENHCELTLTARFRPKGLTGLGYWYSVTPLHKYVFGSLLNGIRKEAETLHDDSLTTESSLGTASAVPS
ncbi:SDR family oxidoreductase [Calycomorphotria hydatis]|uniref:3 beta-hydroxysteroid dehydrogenase/Delta 5-->4-isomerase n=1 Tax=Calycomorphotria hydatis TaxID=2528027 RepID=A0A517TAY8_9PLAN|nr:SDR family oxidoreductase [Calycomorphotria hydatis]QDT65534.1 3 beta-hydroxysteroid dehydrogenase/Delta 5-->4-isomerase [Calycomorphotria hydatis]